MSSLQASTFTAPFVLMFITGNIAVCFGCKNKYVKTLQPPEDLCLKHQDWHQFTQSNGEPQSKYGVYYHCKPECVIIANQNVFGSVILVLILMTLKYQKTSKKNLMMYTSSIWLVVIIFFSLVASHYYF